MEVLVFVIFLSIVIIINHVTAINRTVEMRKKAAKLGVDFEVEDDWLESTVKRFELFNRRGSSWPKNIIKGIKEDTKYWIFDFSYKPGKKRRRRTVVLLENPNINLPNFEMRPESGLNGVAEFFGSQDINFDSHPVFSKNYLLKGDNEQAVRQLFKPDVLDKLQKYDNHSLEGDGCFMIYYVNCPLQPVEEIENLLESALTIHKEFRTESKLAVNP